ncbi:uncharacterized protein LOC127705604 [Mytilus californianus]|uniref:uncharacterized protein LOC127705604 n=1 Tax=Mytilus californianus TaxID=6549 RepID=UPI0022477CED|nr:uncharacterized protein LOC127705604 [Mytilus californianus]
MAQDVGVIVYGECCNGVLCLPVEVNQFDKSSAGVFASLLEEEGYCHYEARVMLAGEQGTGSASAQVEVVSDGLTQSPLSSESLSPVAENDKCCDSTTAIDLLRSDEIHPREKSYINNEENDPFPVQSEILNSKLSSYRIDIGQPSTERKISEKKKNIRKAAVEPSPVILEQSFDDTKQRRNIIKTPPSVLRQTTPDILNVVVVPTTALSVPAKETQYFSYAETETKAPEKNSTTEVLRNRGIIGKLKKLFGVQRHVDEIKVVMTKERFWEETVKTGKTKLHHRKIAPVIIWDVGGQDVFYSTHQTFLTYRAIYLLVLDGRRNLDDPCMYEQYLPGKSGHKTPRENI